MLQKNNLKGAHIDFIYKKTEKNGDKREILFSIR